MGFDQYHEPPEELPAKVRTFARLCASLTEEAEAIGWYEQRLAGEADDEAREIAKGVLFVEGDIVEHGEAAEAVAGDGGGESTGPSGGTTASGSLGIGSLRSA